MVPKTAGHPPWYEVVKMVEPHIVGIRTPSSSGTGFLLARAATASVCVIATAAHVIADAHAWEEAIRIEHFSSEQTLLVREPTRAIVMDPQGDTAAIVFDPKHLQLPEAPFPLPPQGQRLRVGAEVGWLGFPAIPGACASSGDR